MSKRLQKIFENNSLPGFKILENGNITGLNNEFNSKIELQGTELKGSNFLDLIVDFDEVKSKDSMSLFTSGNHRLRLNDEIDINLRCIVESVQMMRDEAIQCSEVKSEWYFKKKSKVNI